MKKIIKKPKNSKKRGLILRGRDTHAYFMKTTKAAKLFLQNTKSVLQDVNTWPNVLRTQFFTPSSSSALNDVIIVTASITILG